METEVLALLLGALLGFGGARAHMWGLARKRPTANIGTPTDPNPALALYQQHKRERMNG